MQVATDLDSPRFPDAAVAFGHRAGPAPDPFLVGLAALGLLSEAAEERPLLGVVDDAQWLDRASARALGFVARRLLAERIALVFGARELGEALAGFPELHVGPLGHRDARALLASALPARLDERVLERIIVETRGNPLALLELPRGLTPAQLAGGFGLPAALPLSVRIEESFTRRLARLPGDARRLLLVAAADPVGDLALVWRAAQRLGIPESAAQTVESDGLVAFGAGVVFRHPLVRSAVYRAFGADARSEAHRALADATDPAIDPDRHAWHRTQATSMPDEEVAAELERSAARALARGGFAAAAAFLERASVLTLDPARPAGRAWPRPRQPSRQAPSMRRSPLLPARTRDHWTNSSEPKSTSSAPGTPILHKALRAFHSEEIGTEEGLRWLWLAGRAAGFIWDHEAWDSLTMRQIRAARDVGALAHLPLALSTRVGVHISAGELGGRVTGPGGGHPRRGHRWSHRP